MESRGTQTVLVVDDEPVARENLELLLNENGFRTVTAADGQEALERASEHTFDVVLLDIKMPRVSGIEVLPKLLAEYPDTSIIMVTAVADVETAVEAMKSGAQDYVLKPFSLDEVLVRVRKALDRRRLALHVKHYQKDLEDRLVQQAKELRELTSQTVQALIGEELSAQQAHAKGRSPRTSEGGVDIRAFGAKMLRRLNAGRD